MSGPSPVTVRLVSSGARTGQAREVRVYAFADGDHLFVLAAGMAGSTRTPAWAFNLRANPRGWVVRDGVKTEVRAFEVEAGPERDRLWQLACAGFRYFPAYQRHRPEPIPIFILETR